MSDNVSTSCPARMSDGRIFTDYRPRCSEANFIGAQPTSSFDYRMRLTRDASKIMDQLNQAQIAKNSCAPCTDTMLPEQYQQQCNKQVCWSKPGMHSGLGLGRVYEYQDSDVARSYYPAGGIAADGSATYAKAG